jgi:hypothetical protein
VLNHDADQKPVEVDFGSILSTELTIVMSSGYPIE